jgi:integrase
MSQENGNDRIAVGKHVTIYCRGTKGIFVADYHYVDPNGQRQHIRKSLKTRQRRIAEQRARKLDDQIENGELKTESIASPKTIEQLAAAFVESKKTDGCSKKTISKYECETKLFGNFLADKGVTRLSAVTPHQADRYKAYRKNNDGLDDYTVYTLMIVIKTFLRWAKSRGFISANPFVDIRIPKPRRRKHPAATFEQINAVVTKAATEASQWVAIFATLAFTGLRIGELVALRREDVDLKERLIRVRVREGWKPKTAGSEREVPIHRRLAALLTTVKKSKGDYFFSAQPSRQYPEGDHRVNPREANVDFQELAAACGHVVGREQRGLTLHALRRFFKTFCLDSGVPKPMVDFWTGHVDESSMDFFYYDPQKSKEWMERVPFGEPDGQGSDQQ